MPTFYQLLLIIISYFISNNCHSIYFMFFPLQMVGTNLYIKEVTTVVRTEKPRMTKGNVIIVYIVILTVIFSVHNGAGSSSYNM
jgi:Ca2+/H+ antiporter